LEKASFARRCTAKAAAFPVLLLKSTRGESNPGRESTAHFREIATPRDRDCVHAQIRTVIFPSAEKCKKALFCRPNLNRYEMMKPQRRATTENRIRLASDARTIPGEPRQAVFVASFVAKSPRTARLGIAKRVESLSEPPL
jgi:hypothetical protein